MAERIVVTHLDAEGERERIFALIEKEAERLMVFWPYTTATEPLAVLRGLAEKIEPGRGKPIDAIVSRLANAELRDQNEREAPGKKDAAP